jgi:hypothetical protein
MLGVHECIELYNTPTEAGSSSTENLTCASEYTG